MQRRTKEGVSFFIVFKEKVLCFANKEMISHNCALSYTVMTNQIPKPKAKGTHYNNSIFSAFCQSR